MAELSQMIWLSLKTRGIPITSCNISPLLTLLNGQTYIVLGYTYNSSITANVTTNSVSFKYTNRYFTDENLQVTTTNPLYGAFKRQYYHVKDQIAT